MTIRCPIPQCRSENDVNVKRCENCGTDLETYIKLLFFPDYLFDSGIYHAQQGQYREAERSLQAALYLRPNDTEAAIVLGKVQALRGAYSTALETWNRVLQEDQKNESAKRAIQAVQEHLFEHKQ